jgi:hypothetical protein
VRLQAEREAREWNKKEMGRRLLRAEGLRQGSATNLARQIRRWEAGEVFPRDWASAYATAFGVKRAELFGPEPDDRQPGDLGEPVDLFDAVRLPNGNGRPVDARYVESIRRTNQALVHLDTLHGGSGLLPHALRVFGEVHRKIGAGAYERRMARDLIAAAGETGEVAAWIAYDADRRAVSRQLIHEALLLSRQAGDRAMELFELGHLSMLSLRMHRPAEALRIADEICESSRMAPRVAALFEIRRGRALAQLGEEHRAFAALEKARAAILDGIGTCDPHWTWWIDDLEIMRQRSAAHAGLGQWQQALPLREEVVARLRDGLSPARFDLAELLEALVHVRDWSRAEEIITEAADLAAALGPCRTTVLLRETAVLIGQAADAPSTVTDAAGHIRHILGTAPQHRPDH